MSKVYEKMPCGQASTKLNVVIPSGVKSVTLTFGDNESQLKEKASKGGRRKVCD